MKERKEQAPRKTSPYVEQVVSINRVTKVTKGGRHMRFAATVAVGDKKGRVGLGTGKSNDVPDAIRKALQAAQKNVIKIELVEGRTISHEVIGKFGTSMVKLLPLFEKIIHFYEN